jgi:hypothetical protein
MKDIDTIFSLNLKKVAEVPQLQFDQPVFETPIDNSNSKEISQESIKDESPVVKPISQRAPISEGPPSFHDIIAEQLDDVNFNLTQAFKELSIAILQGSDESRLEKVKRSVQETLSAISQIRNTSKKVHVI